MVKTFEVQRLSAAIKCGDLIATIDARGLAHNQICFNEF